MNPLIKLGMIGLLAGMAAVNMRIKAITKISPYPINYFAAAICIIAAFLIGVFA